MSGGQDHNEVVLGRSDGAFRRVGPVVLGRDMLERNRGDCWRKKTVRSAEVSLSRISWVMGREWDEKKTQAERKADT